MMSDRTTGKIYFHIFRDKEAAGNYYHLQAVCDIGSGKSVKTTLKNFGTFEYTKNFVEEVISRCREEVTM